VNSASAAKRGFTLIEAMIVVAIVGVLAAIAIPGYASYVKRSHIFEAVSRLADARARMEDYFQDTRSYVDAGGACGVPPPGATGHDAFALTCSATSSTFVYTATGRADHGMASFTYAVDETGAQTTVSVPAGWSRRADCWTIRADGLCA
jgi:type IV pilus assembly protein PilE